MEENNENSLKQQNDILRIAVLGPESTGKSTLSEQLAIHYKTIWMPEYAREYLKNKADSYNLEDILKIAQHQLQLEKNNFSNAKKIIFADTELIIAKVWCEAVYKICPDWISKNMIQNKYDFYLLTYPDIPWEPDPLRENPHRRDFFFRWYEQELKNMNAQYAIIKGFGKDRLQNSISAIDHFLKK
ncbi:MAG: ATP-binding protein [Bacteroidia bacterium]